MRPPAWLRPVAVLIGTYFAIMYVATFWMGVWHDWDWGVLRWVSAKAPPALSPRVVVLDVTNYDKSKPQNDRLVIARFLEDLTKKTRAPVAVLLDFFFDAGGSTAPDAATKALTKALDDATQAKLPVYATVSKLEMVAGRFEGVDWSSLRELDWTNVYDHLSGGLGHTILNVYQDGLFYQACFPQVPKLDSAGAPVGRIDLRALPALAHEAEAARSLSACDPTVMNIIRVGSHDEFMNEAVDRISLAQPFPQKAELGNKYVVIASLEKDVVGGLAGRSNPELLGWAISDLLEKSSGTPYFEPIPYGDMLLVLIGVFSSLAVVAFVAAFLFLRRSRVGKLRTMLPWISAAAAAAITLGLFAGLEAFLLSEKHIYPQVSLVALSILIAAGLSGERGRQMLYEQMSQVDAAPEESNDYDVFISYAHDELTWVFENVYQPLRAVTLPDGRKLAIFFDTSSIQVGTAWQEKISLAIDGSRFVVPVYSDTYFTRPHCRFEVRRAHRKWIAQGENSRCVFPIMRGHPKIDQTVDDIQAVSIDDNPGVVAEVVAEIVRRLTPVVSPVSPRA